MNRISAMVCAGLLAATLLISFKARGQSCTASFGLFLTAPTLYQCINLSTGNNLTYKWYVDIGATPISYGKDFQHYFLYTGNRRICLTVQDSLNSSCYDSTCRFVNVPDLKYDSCSINFSYTLDTAFNLVKFDILSPQTPSRNYRWVLGVADTSTVASPSRVYLPGTHTVCLLLENTTDSCRNSVCHQVVIPYPTGAGEPAVQHGGLQVYPTRFADKLFIRLPQAARGNASFRLMDMMGREAWAETRNIVANETVMLAIPALANGNYLLAIDYQGTRHYVRMLH